MKRIRTRGNCVYTTATEATVAEWIACHPGAGEDDCNHGSRIVRQQGNGSIRLVYPIPRSAGGGAFRPFVFPAPHKPHKSYPLDELGIDPRDKEATEAVRRYFGIK